MEQPQPELQTEPQMELHTDDTQKNKKNNNANCSPPADSIASPDSQKNKGWCIMHDKIDHTLDDN